MRATFPPWLKKKLVINEEFFRMKRLLSEASINTVCESSRCPNLSECFSQNFATFLILGKACTRNCSFCSVTKDAPAGSVDDDEPSRIAGFVRRVGLKYCVITSVTRDDLPDGGASQFVDVIRSIRSIRPAGVKVEVLVPDFGGRRESIEHVLNARPDIFGHNIETTRRLYPIARQGASYVRSLGLLRLAKENCPDQLTKSGIMIGLGESDQEVLETMKDIRSAGCDILTIGQYLKPGRGNLNIRRFATPDEFERYEVIGLAMGFRSVNSGPYVRSSYNANLRGL